VCLFWNKGRIGSSGGRRNGIVLLFISLARGVRLGIWENKASCMCNYEGICFISPNSENCNSSLPWHLFHVLNRELEEIKISPKHSCSRGGLFFRVVRVSLSLFN